MLGKLIFSVVSLIFLGGTVVWAGYNLQTGTNYPVQVFDTIKNIAPNTTMTLPKVLNPDAVPDNMNVLLIGVGGKGHEGANLTDSLMVVTVDNVDKNIGLISIPRDFLVFDEQDYYYKINSIYAFALEKGMTEEEAAMVLAEYIQNILGIKIDHYVKIDFQGFENIVDKLGGVDIEVKEAIEDKHYPGPNYSYETFSIEAGTQHIDGETALKYARSRYSSKQGDVDRAARQQQIIDAVVKKASSLNPVWDLPKILSMVGIFKQNVSTDFSFDTLRDLYITYQGLDSFSRHQLVLDFDLTEGVLVEQQRYFGRSLGYVLVPRAGDKNYTEIREYVSNLVNINEFRPLVSQVKKEKATVDVYSNLNKNTTQDMVKSLESKGMKITVKYIGEESIQSLASTNKLYRNIKVSRENIELDLADSQKYLQERFTASILQPNDLMGDTQELTVTKGIVPQQKHIETEADFVLYLYKE
jgi:LCP family protein required for cell wall assembly